MMLMLVRDRDRIREFIDAVLGSVLDAPNAARLLEILEAYVESGGNVTRAARRVHLNRQTFYLRLQQIEERTGCSLASVDERLSLSLSLFAIRLGLLE